MQQSEREKVGLLCFLFEIHNTVTLQKIPKTNTHIVK